MVHVVGEICRCLYGAILRESSNVRSLPSFLLRPPCNLYSSFMIAQAAKAYGTAIEDLTTILGYLSPYFPFTAGGSVVARRDIKVSVLARRGGPRDHRLVRYLTT